MLLPISYARVVEKVKREWVLDPVESVRFASASKGGDNPTPTLCGGNKTCMGSGRYPRRHTSSKPGHPCHLAHTYQGERAVWFGC
jgi:hypothetical protein